MKLEFTCFVVAILVLFIALPIMNCATDVRYGCPVGVIGTVAQQAGCSE